MRGGDSHGEEIRRRQEKRREKEMLRVKPPLTPEATIDSVETLLTEQYVRHVFAQAINERMAYIAWRRRWLKRLRWVMVIGAALMAGLMVGRL